MPYKVRQLKNANSGKIKMYLMCIIMSLSPQHNGRYFIYVASVSCFKIEHVSPHENSSNLHSFYSWERPRKENIPNQDTFWFFTRHFEFIRINWRSYCLILLSNTKIVFNIHIYLPFNFITLKHDSLSLYFIINRIQAKYLRCHF